MAFGLETQLWCLPAVGDKRAPCPRFPPQESFVLVRWIVHANPLLRAWHPGGSRIEFFLPSPVFLMLGPSEGWAVHVNLCGPGWGLNCICMCPPLRENSKDQGPGTRSPSSSLRTATHLLCDVSHPEATVPPKKGGFGAREGVSIFPKSKDAWVHKNPPTIPTQSWLLWLQNEVALRSPLRVLWAGVGGGGVPLPSAPTKSPCVHSNGSWACVCVYVCVCRGAGCRTQSLPIVGTQCPQVKGESRFNRRGRAVLRGSWPPPKE